MNDQRNTSGTQQPFPGLRPFEANESNIFFGRGKQIDELLARLEDHRFVAVVGASGSGKSSLVRAGLLPSLEGGFLSDAGSDWRMVIMRPGQCPFSRLATALHTASSADVADANAIAFVEATLRSGPRGLIEAIQDADLLADTNVLVLIDQFEEIFRFRQRQGSLGQMADGLPSDEDRNDATGFVNMLLATAGCELQVYIVLTMRSDFLGDCDAFHGLPEAINNCQFLVPRLRRDQLRETITGPLDMFAARAEDGLVNRILNEIGSDPDQLPLMQHLLLRMWTRERQRPGEPVLKVSDYLAAGGLENALSQHADEAYEELGDDESKRVAAVMFRSLCDTGAEARSTRRLITVAEVAVVADVDAEKVSDVAKVFLRPDRSFLISSPPGEITPATTLDISHEALIRQWGRLSDWASLESRSAGRYRRLFETARLWEEKTASLLVSPELDIALFWREYEKPAKPWADRYGGGFELSMRFLDASVAEKHADVDRKRQAARRRSAILVSTLAIVTSLMVVAVVLWWRSRQQAIALNDLFVEGELSLGTVAARDGQMSVALMKYWTAYEKTTSAQPAHRSARNLIAPWSELAGRPMIHDSAVRKVAFSRNGNTVLTLTDSVAQLWDFTTGNPRAEKVVAKDGVWSALAVSPDGTRFIIATNNSAQIYDMQTVRPIGKPFDLGEPISVAIFSADGSTVVIRGENHMQFWNVLTGEPRGRRWSNTGTQFALSPDGSGFIESNGIQATLVEINSDVQIDGPDFGATDFLAYSPDGTSIVQVRSPDCLFWDAKTLKRQAVKLQHEAIRTVVFSRDGSLLLTGSSRNSGQLWNPKTGERIGKPLQHEGTLVTATFSPDGTTVLTGSADNSARLWNSSTGEPMSYPLRHLSTVGTVAYSPDGRTLLTGSVGGGARLWHIRGYQSMKRQVPEAIWSPDSDPSARLNFDFTGGLNAATEGLAGDVHSSAGAIEKQIASAWNRGGDQVLVATDRTLTLRDAGATGKDLAKFEHDAPVVTACFGGRSDSILSTTFDTALLWDALNPERRAKEFRHSSRILSAAVSPDGKFVLTGGEDNSACLWNAVSGDLIATVVHADAVRAVAFSPDSRLMATGSADNTASIRSVRAGESPRTTMGHQDTVLDVMFSPDGTILLTASDDRTALFWDVASGELSGDPLNHSEQVTAARYSQDGRHVLTIDDQGSAFLWDVTPPAADDARRLQLSIEWRSGTYIDSHRTIHRLSQADWLERKRTLDALGGPCDVRSWDELSESERNELAGRNRKH